MFYYAYINQNNIVTQIVALPSAINVAGYIPIESDDQTLIGKYYNASTGLFEEVTAFYYAQLNEKGIVTAVFEMPSEVNDDSLIRVQTLDQDLVGKYYVRENGTFIEPPISVIAELSTTEINHGEAWLDDVLDDKADKAEILNNKNFFDMIEAVVAFEKEYKGTEFYKTYLPAQYLIDKFYHEFLTNHLLHAQQFVLRFFHNSLNYAKIIL